MSTTPDVQPATAGNKITVDVQTHRKSQGADYFVRITCDGREVTPHVFTERWKAEYEAAHYAWVFHLRDEKPWPLDYDAERYPNVDTDSQAL